MSDESAEHFAKQAIPEMLLSTDGRSVTLTITLHPNGQIEFSLPANKILAYGLLGVAQEQLTKLHLIAELQQAKASASGLNGLLKKMGRR